MSDRGLVPSWLSHSLERVTGWDRTVVGRTVSLSRPMSRKMAQFYVLRQSGGHLVYSDQGVP